MNRPCCLLLPALLSANAYAASLEDILKYDMQGISLSQPIDTIRSTVEARGFTTNAWPRNNPGNWKFSKKHKGSSEVYEVRLDRDGTVKSIRYQKSGRSDCEIPGGIASIASPVISIPGTSVKAVWRRLTSRTLPAPVVRTMAGD